MFCVIIITIFEKKSSLYYKALEISILSKIGLSDWLTLKKYDVYVSLNSKKAVDNYSDIKFFKENPEKLSEAYEIISQKNKYQKTITEFLKSNEYMNLAKYSLIEKNVNDILPYTKAFFVSVNYTSPTGRSTNNKLLSISYQRIRELLDDKSLLMTKGEYNKYLKEQKQEQLDQKQHDYYEKVNNIIDFANENKDILIIKDDVDELDKQVYSLFDRTISSIKKIKNVDSEEWELIDKIISSVNQAVDKIVVNNK
ncbi:MAG: hypothetical protein IJ079_03615 [Lachnospiraceae bacterium]|nr:hypothetical protein [Lachnospiraceae bacterium]